MTPNQYYRSTPKNEVEKTCIDAKTTPANFKQIALAGGSCVKGLAERLASASGGKMTEMEILYPERYESDIAKSFRQAS